MTGRNEMKTAIVCGSIQDNATTLVVADELKSLMPGAEIVGLHDFKEMFTGDYVDLQNAKPSQKVVLKTIAKADIVVFVVPTYYKSMPGVLKNFFDVVREPKLYKDKTIGVTASNHKNQDYGARHTVEVLQGLSVFSEIKITLVPEILIINHQDIDHLELKRFAKLIQNYASGS